MASSLLSAASAVLTACAFVAASPGGDLTTVPVISLADSLEETATAVRSALGEFGFFYLRDHGIPDELIRDQFVQAEKLFALPAETKRGLGFDEKLDVGYMGDQALDEEGGKRDLKEGFTLTNNHLLAPTVTDGTPAAPASDHSYTAEPEDDPLQGEQRWPPRDVLPDYEKVARLYFRHAHRVLRRLHAALFEAAAVPEEERARLGARPFCVLKQMRYAPAGPTADRSSGAAADGAQQQEGIGAGAHTDWGSLTLLATDGLPGLQIERPEGWLAVGPRPGCLIVNAGDQVDLWSGGRFRSANHRVVNANPRPRFSTALFGYFSPHERVGSWAGSSSRATDEKPLTSLEYFHFKLNESVAVGRRAAEEAWQAAAACDSGCLPEGDSPWP